MHMTTNADFLDNFIDSQEISRIDKVTLSAYDIFKDSSKYINYAKKIRDCMLTYTFTEDDICRAEEYTDMCYRAEVKFRAVTSHSASSWESISKSELCSAVSSMYAC